MATPERDLARIRREIERLRKSRATGASGVEHPQTAERLEVPETLKPDVRALESIKVQVNIDGKAVANAVSNSPTQRGSKGK